ncbi:hypothetical protein QEO94_00485 [Kingella negevensis]|uniref:hypothetical protein n=1 Tax=Kingella negevensis TaxID=1522312 RepID=UPI0025426D7C|nr:hypothetical protein [Kingella negevensis]MDK4681143.1 hypothetical protein [Kingella negevensis]MDK4683345.1 hypothetical protein [Kingella negevensis]MDK4691525.1 hypothetical protein [Kingella negevensis]MDK4693324.1 hypothetical protein [Kingella negevensis]MDK4699624.1 hypothetical protein [Kingella negevensis]
MKNLQFPLNFQFKILTPSNDFSVLDAQGNEVAYTRQKIFKLKEGIEIFRNSSRQERLYQINADRILDFNACYKITNEQGLELGSIRRSGMRSLWQTHYEIFGANSLKLYDIQETNPWISVLDGLLGEVPILGMFTGYFFNPSYTITDTQGKQDYLLQKEASLLERKFSLQKMGNAANDELVTLSCMMLMLMERADG